MKKSDCKETKKNGHKNVQQTSNSKSLETGLNGLLQKFLKPGPQTSPKPLSEFGVSRGRRPKKTGTSGVKKTRTNFVADFETITDPNDCRVWLWGLVPVNTPDYDSVEWGTSIDSFIVRIAQQNGICYFHNLKFDAHFILDWLLKNGYTHIEDSDLYENKTFKSLISDMGKFYSVTVRWENGHSTEFRDSFKKLPMAVRRIATSFKLEMSKGELDYDKYRAPGEDPTDEELDYLKRDVSIVATAMKEVIDSGMKKLTVASDAMNEYKQLNGITYFNKLFPVFDHDMDMEIRRAYRGGFTYADERFKGRIVRSGIVLDVNSLYPSVMKFNLIPYGDPMYQRGYVEPTKTHPLTIFSVTFTAKLKENHIPCIQIKGNNMFLGTEYLKEIDEPTTLMVTNVDWDLYNDHYDIEVLSWNGGFKFHAVQGLFDSYIDKWSEIKARETGGKREIAKLHLNSLYGKFASNPNVTSKIPILKDDVVKLVRGKPETRPPVYTAAGAFITAHARDITIRSAQANYDVFAYADTDSLHLLQNDVPASINVHPSDLGAWKFEYAFENAYYIRPKAYLERKLDGTYVNRIAGLPIDVSSALTFDDLVEGKVLHGKLNPRVVPGGVVLKDVPFELKLS